MSLIKSRDTKPELIVRHYLYSRGYRYRKNVKGLPGTPDIVLLKYRTVIFVHGCFWHGHEADGHLPQSNRPFWEQKIKRNKERDARVKEQLRNSGWKVMTIWECQLKPANRQNTLLAMEYFLNHAYLERFHRPVATFHPAARHTKDYDYNPASNLIAAETATEYGKTMNESQLSSSEVQKPSDEH